MDINGKHIAVLIDNYFEQSEFEEPISALKAAGAEVSVISASGMKLTGMNHADKGDEFEADLLLESASSDDYDALVLPGGAINADSLRLNEIAQEWAIDFLDSGRPIAVICHAPWLLVSADVVEGRKLTSYHTIQDDIKNAGGEWVDLPVVIDRNLITSRQPDDIPKFNDAIIEMLNKRVAVATSTVADLPYVGSDKDVEEDIRLQSLGYSKERDEISRLDEEDMLSDQDLSDPDEIHPSGLIPEDERDGAQGDQ